MILVAVMGQTASGKTALAEALASRLDAGLVNADAFQAYRGMDIGTAKPESRDLYRLLDVKRPDESYGVGEFCVLAAEELRALYEAGRSAVVVGGTGQYVRAEMEEYTDLLPDPDPMLRVHLTNRLREEGLPALALELQTAAPEVAAKTDLQNPARVTRALERLADGRPCLQFGVPYSKRLKISMSPEKGDVEERIVRRTRSMMHNGWIEEVRRLRAEGYEAGDPGFRAIGYRTIAALLDGDLATENAERAIVRETVAYAKRQRTWLRSEPGLQTFVSGDALGLQKAWESIDHVLLES